MSNNYTPNAYRDTARKVIASIPTEKVMFFGVPLTHLSRSELMAVASYALSRVKQVETNHPPVE